MTRQEIQRKLKYKESELLYWELYRKKESPDIRDEITHLTNLLKGEKPCPI